MDLELLRKQIDQIDETIVKLLDKRLEIVKKIKEYKDKKNLPIQDIKREEKLLKNLKNKAKHEALKTEIENIYHLIINLSKKFQKN